MKLKLIIDEFFLPMLISENSSILINDQIKCMRYLINNFGNMQVT